MIKKLLSRYLPDTRLSTASFWSEGGGVPYRHSKSGKTYYVISEQAINCDNTLAADAQTRTVVYTDCVKLYTRPYAEFHEMLPVGVRRFVRIIED